eukprot:6756475-Pyramimonas_sp.AAC.1
MNVGGATPDSKKLYVCVTSSRASHAPSVTAQALHGRRSGPGADARARRATHRITAAEGMVSFGA